MAALFIGWGPVVRGREKQSLQVFQESVEYWTRLQREGQIESFEPVALDPHGGDLQGFVLIRGNQEQLDQIQHSDEFRRSIMRASHVVDRLGIVDAHTGEDLNRLFASFQEEASALTSS